jgi:hypothetical protein
MKGLKQNLYSEIQRRGVIRLEEAYQLAHDLGYDYENAKRRLREMGNSGLIEPIKNKKGFISHYRYIGKEIPKYEIYIQRQGNLI